MPKKKSKAEELVEQIDLKSIGIGWIGRVEPGRWLMISKERLTRIVDRFLKENGGIT